MSAQVPERTHTQSRAVDSAWSHTEAIALAAVRLGEMFRSIVTWRVGLVLGRRTSQVCVDFGAGARWIREGVVVEIPRRRVA